MSLTYDEAKDDMLTLLKNVWDPTTFKMFYEAKRDDRDTSQNAWAMVLIRHASGGQKTLGGVGSRTFERVGAIIVTINTPSTSGLSQGYQLAKLVADAYEGISSPNGVWFREVRINESGREGTFNQFNVIIDFSYDEIK